MPRQVTSLLSPSKQGSCFSCAKWFSGTQHAECKSLRKLLFMVKKSNFFWFWLKNSIILNATTVASTETQIRKYQSCQLHYCALINLTETVGQFLRSKAFNEVRLLSSFFGTQKKKQLKKHQSHFKD